MLQCRRRQIHAGNDYNRSGSQTHAPDYAARFSRYGAKDPENLDDMMSGSIFVIDESPFFNLRQRIDTAMPKGIGELSV
jgi:hypothetical protein